MTAPALQVDSLTVRLGGRVVLETVGLAVDRGDLVGLIGPNGAGKTTLLRAILGLVPIDGGRVHVDADSPAQTKGTAVGYVPQRHEFAWDFPISVAGAVMTGRTRRIGLFRRPRSVDRDAVAAALDAVGMVSLAKRSIGELSGGQRQRVLVARALALQPRVLLLDEPFSAVDSPTQDVLTELLDVLRAAGCALLMTTHDLAIARAICTRLVLINRTVIAAGPPGELRDPAVWLRAFGVAEPLVTMTAGHR